MSLTETKTLSRKAQAAATKAAARKTAERQEQKRPQKPWLRPDAHGRPHETETETPPPRPGKQVMVARQATKVPALLYDRHEVVALVGYSYPTIWKMMRRDEFPRSRICGGKSMWLSTEIDAWLASLPVRPLKGDAAPAEPEAAT